MEKSRTEYSTMNTVVAMISRIAAILMGFVTRVVFTHTLSESYVGINGLFTDILNVLSLTELGVETAISYALYRPIAQGDIRKQQILMRMFRTFYRITAGCVVVLGLSIIPFFDVLMKNRPDVDHLMLIYFLYLANSVVSYLLVYKLLSNICISRKADRMYPYLKEKTKEQLPEDERKDIFRNIKAMLMHKLGNVVVNNTDNLLISSFVGVISVGIYSNYFLLIGSVRQVLDQIFQGITASVGNLGATEDEGRVKSIFETAFFIGNWLYGAAAICLYELLNPFVELAFGKQYLFDMPVVLILCINFYINGTRKAVLTFRDSLGLFWFDRYKALVEAVLNLAISLILVWKFGTFGVFAGTFLSTMLTSVWVEPYVLYRHRLHAKVAPFFVRYVIYTAVTGVIWYGTDRLCLFADGGRVIVFLKRFFICAVVPSLVMLLCFCHTKEFGIVKRKALAIWKKRWTDGRKK